MYSMYTAPSDLDYRGDDGFPPEEVELEDAAYPCGEILRARVATRDRKTTTNNLQPANGRARLRSLEKVADQHEATDKEEICPF